MLLTYTELIVYANIRMQSALIATQKNNQGSNKHFVFNKDEQFIVIGEHYYRLLLC